VHPGSIRAPVRRAMAQCREEAGFESGLDHHHPHAKSQNLAAMFEQRSLTHELPHARAHLHDACPKTKGPPFLEALVCTIMGFEIRPSNHIATLRSARTWKWKYHMDLASGLRTSVRLHAIRD
jgi:hypothetical protein